LTFQRVEMNQNGGCPFGACVSLSGTLDMRESGLFVEEGLTTDCWDERNMARPLECLAQYDYDLDQITRKMGSQRLEYYGYVLSTPRQCEWWNEGFAGYRTCVYTQRTKLGHFPENDPEYRWQGELLGRKAEAKRKKKGYVVGTAYQDDPQNRGCPAQEQSAEVQGCAHASCTAAKKDAQAVIYAANNAAGRPHCNAWVKTRPDCRYVNCDRGARIEDATNR
jgi:hypothetical protein